MIISAVFTIPHTPDIEVVVKMDSEAYVPGAGRYYYETCATEVLHRRLGDESYRFELAGFYADRTAPMYEPWSR